MARGRPKKSTVQVTFRLNFDYLQKLKLLNPQLLTRNSDGDPKFRHGALGRYLERLIREDLEKRADLAKIDISAPHVNLDEIMGKSDAE
jgi:hypothetical protein